MKSWKLPILLWLIQVLEFNGYIVNRSQRIIHMVSINILLTCDQPNGSTETKYIKLNTKAQNIFCRLNENLTTFSNTLTGETRKQKEKKVFSFKVYTKVKCY